MKEIPKHQFYPMINLTMMRLLLASLPEERVGIIEMLCSYPKYNPTDEEKNNPLFIAIELELDRQYARWNKGGIK